MRLILRIDTERTVGSDAQARHHFPSRLFSARGPEHPAKRRRTSLDAAPSPGLPRPDMYFTWFNLMPWPYLAEDFRERHRSIWVDIPNALYDPRKGHHLYHRYMNQLEY